MGLDLSSLSEGAVEGAAKGIGSLAKDVASSIRVLFTGVDPEKQAALEEKLMELEAAGDEAQAAINNSEASNPSVFVSGWRPFIGWTCGVSFAYNYVVTPFLQGILVVCGSSAKLPIIDIATMMPVLLGMLGLSTNRMFEKMNNVARIK